MIGTLPFTVDHGLALVRIVVGLLFIGHGAQKLFGWFGGPGLGGMAGWLRSMGLPAAFGIAVFTGLCEFVGGLLFALGGLTPFAALALSASMLGAITTVHWPHGLWAQNNGFEYPLVLLAIAAAVGLAGPGAYALDPVLGLVWPRQAIYLVGLALEAVGVAVLLAARNATVRPAGATA